MKNPWKLGGGMVEEGREWLLLSRILADATLREGKYFQSFPNMGQREWGLR